MPRPSFGLALIAKNEAENVKRLFESVDGVFDEIHLTDTGSTDGTPDVARALGIKVHNFTWVDDFAEARNASFAPLKTDYIAWLDLDDVLLNKERVLLFRDEVMPLADYWLAPYHYASDKNGNPVCTFTRERIIKNGMGMHWKYFLHEGIVPAQSVRAQATTAFVVKHMRTDEDMKKDASRNLRVFEKNIGHPSFDARMRYYYGKELFEAQRPADAIPQFEQAMIDPRLELHDRLICMQYACYAYIHTGKHQKAIEIATQGTVLAPNRAEFHCIIGDAYIKMGKLAEAKPWFGAAKHCEFNQAGPNAAIFSNAGSYTDYPRNQLARIHANMGNWPAAEAEAQGSLQAFASEESRLILDEIGKAKTLVLGYKDAKPCDDIVFTTAPVTAYEFDPGKMKEKAMGGSETALIEMAYWIKKLSGRPVKVFNMRKERQTFDGVEYIPADEVNRYMAEHKPHLHVAWRHTFKITDGPTFVWSHDLQTPGVENVGDYTRVMCLTPFHKRYMMATQGVPEEKIYVTRNGVNPEHFAAGFTHEEKDPNLFVFSSSPDRGLDRAMIVLDEVRKKHPEIRLIVRYGIEHLERYGLKGLADKLRQMFAERPWVQYKGAATKEELYADFRRAAYCLQPSDFIETSKITAREQLYCGVYQITRKVGGLIDTMAEPEQLGHCTLVDSDCITPEQYQRYVDATIQAMDEKAYLRIQNVDPNEWNWQGVAAQWLEDLPKLR